VVQKRGDLTETMDNAVAVAGPGMALDLRADRAAVTAVLSIIPTLLTNIRKYILDFLVAAGRQATPTGELAVAVAAETAMIKFMEAPAALERQATLN
jgi:hypothetical protein